MYFYEDYFQSTTDVGLRKQRESVGDFGPCVRWVRGGIGMRWASISVTVGVVAQAITHSMRLVNWGCCYWVFSISCDLFFVACIFHGVLDK